MAHAHNIYGRLSTSVLDELHPQGIPTIMTLHDLKPICPSYLMLSKGLICEQCKGGRYHRAVINKCHKGSYATSAVHALESWMNHALKKYDSVRCFVAPSRFLRDKCIEFGWAAEKIVYLPNFTDTQTIRSSTQPGSYLLYLGRLSHEKGVKTVLSTLAELMGNIPLVVIGDGPERANLEKLADERHLNVRSTGYLSGAALQDSLAWAKAVAMPSKWYENAPISLLESSAYGKPVIGAHISGIPEIIDDGGNGFLFEPGNVAELTLKIQCLTGMRDDALKAMGVAAREKVEREFSLGRHYTGLLEIYSNVLGKPCA